MLRLINLENDNWDILLKELKDREEEVKEEVEEFVEEKPKTTLDSIVSLFASKEGK